MDDLDASHETVRRLELLLPEAIVAGGSFSGRLPHPQIVPIAERAATMAVSRDAAVGHCLRSLLQRVGVRENAQVRTGEGGEREWPAGFVGSLTHKGAVVLGVIAPVNSVRMIGIDLERTDSDDLGEIENLIAPEGLAPDMDARLARLLSFSAKEAVFKAQYPATRQQLGFPDVQLFWEKGGDYLVAAVRCPVEGLVVRASVVDRWIVSVAISAATAST